MNVTALEKAFVGQSYAYAYAAILIPSWLLSFSHNLKHTLFLAESHQDFWDPQKMLGTPIWPNMRVPGPRLKNPSAIPELQKKMKKWSECGRKFRSNTPIGYILDELFLLSLFNSASLCAEITSPADVTYQTLR